MGLADRVSSWTTGVVVGTTVLVGGVATLWIAASGPLPVGLLVAEAVAMGVALGLAHLLLRSAVPALGRIEELAETLGGWAAAGELTHRVGQIDDEEVAHLASSVNALLDVVDQQLEVLRDGGALGKPLLDTSPFGVMLVDAEGQVQYLNAAATTLFELRGDPVGRRPIEALAVAEVQESVDTVLAGGAVGEVACTSGSHDLVLRTVPAPEEGVLVFAYDITRFRTAEQARTTFVANVSHELRTPVTAIMGYAETLMAEPDAVPPDLLPLIEAIFRNTRRLRDLFEDLLVLHRIESRRRQLPLQRLRLKPLLEEAVLSAADTASQRRQEFSLDCAADLEALVQPEALEGIVGNLASNACKYTPEGGHIRVRAHQVDREVRIEVEDDGIGIDPIHQERIFERFYRVDVGRSRRAGGTGLGLAIVKHLALASRCRVTMTSQVGRGSTFTVHVPVDPQVAR